MQLETALGLLWGTRGPDGNVPLMEKTLGELDTDHLEAILKTQKQLTPDYVEAIGMVLRDRDRLKIRRKDAVAHTKATQVSPTLADNKWEGSD